MSLDRTVFCRTTAAACAVVVLLVAGALPRSARRLAPADWQPAAPLAAGAFHVHTSRSDGTGTPDEVAAAAARAGLRFVIFTDHGDGTRPPEPPTYRSGVLCVDGVEISTAGGHYAALDLAAAPYPLGGEAADVVEDVARLGGFGIATHPDSPKAELTWTGWDEPFDALEWLNADSEWRDESLARIALTLLTYPFRPAESVAAMFDRPATLAHWDAAARTRRLVGIAGADAHARAGWRSEGDPYRTGPALHLPSYEASFRAFSIHAVLDRELTGRAAEDAALLAGAIRAGHVHTIIDAFARPGRFEFTGRSGSLAVREGDTVPAGEDVLILRARGNGPPGTQTVLFRDGREVARARSAELVYASNQPGAYRAEAWLPGVGRAPVPWAVSNPIYAGRSYSDPPAPARPRVVATTGEIGPEDWRAEHDGQSFGATRLDEGAVALEYRLGEAEGRSQFVAAARDVRLPDGTSGLAFRAQASGPMRVSVQVRAPRGAEAERWRRSVYLDAGPREFVVPFSRMRAAGTTSSPAPAAGTIRSVLFVVDRINSRPGAAGHFRVSALRAVRAGE